MQGKQAKSYGQPILCQSCHHLQQLQLHNIIKPQQTLVLMLLVSLPWQDTDPRGRCPCWDAPQGNGAGAAAPWSAEELRELWLHHQQQSPRSVPALPWPRNTSARHFTHPLVTFSGSQMSRAQSLRCVVVWCVPRSPVRLFHRVCSGAPGRLKGGPGTDNPA